MAKRALCLLLLALTAATSQVAAQGGLLGGVGNAAGSVGNGVSSTAGRVAAPIAKVAAEIAKNLDAQKQIISTALGIDPDTKMSSLFPGIANFNGGQIAKCYNSTVGKENFNMFDNPVFGAIQTYYRNFPENFNLQKLPEKVKNMFKSMNTVATHTMACLGVPTPYQLGMTQFTDWSDAAFKKLMGARDSAANIRSKFARRAVAREADDDAPKANKPKSGILGSATGGLFRFKRADEAPLDPKCIPSNKGALPEKLDWREQGKVTPIKFQDECGSCWTFASLSSLESAYLIKGKTSDGKFDLSEQQLLACGVDQACESGGTAVDAYNYVLTNAGVTGEKELPYNFEKAKCTKEKKKRNAKIKDYCLRGIYVTVDGKPEDLTDAEIQHAVREFGPVYTTIDGEDDDVLKHFKSGVYANPKCSKETNHAVNIVGWDKEAWIVKNSWGEKWGEDGYFRLKRGENMCGVNTYISYPLVA